MHIFSFVTSSLDLLTTSNVLHILQGAFTEMISTILGVFDVQRIQRPRCVNSTDEIISRGHESHGSRSGENRYNDGDNGGAHDCLGWMNAREVL
jgi:hypothetical protein